MGLRGPLLTPHTLSPCTFGGKGMIKTTAFIRRPRRLRFTFQGKQSWSARENTTIAHGVLAARLALLLFASSQAPLSCQCLPLQLLRLPTSPRFLWTAASPFLPALSTLPAFETSSNMNALLSLPELWLREVGLFWALSVCFSPRSSSSGRQRGVFSSHPFLPLSGAQYPASGTKKRVLFHVPVMLSTRVTHTSKGKGPSSRAQVLGGRPSDLGPGCAGGQQWGDQVAWLPGVGGSLALAGTELICLFSGPVCCDPLRCPFLWMGYVGV